MTVSAAPFPVDGSDFDAFDTAGIAAKADRENFPVALRVLPAGIRAHLKAIYAYARLIDDLGDRHVGDRLAMLDRADAELTRAFAGSSVHRIFADIVETVRAIGASRGPLDDLLAANRLDQRKARYSSYEELEAYCALSANPVGRLVLGVLGVSDAHSIALSDRICTGLQLVEHLQDIGEDARDGRIYFPRPDLDRFGVGLSDLLGTDASPGVRRLVAFESARARALLDGGLPLVTRVHGAGRLALAGFVGGGLAQLDEIEKRQFDVLSRLAKAPKRTVLRRAAAIALRARLRAR
ncbi:MAG TPA: squalene synthase HpnC [Acidimicrobiales bacterium]|nr:squalene synthase HpnC [Acidimicrobiales bacterium]